MRLKWFTLTLSALVVVFCLAWCWRMAGQSPSTEEGAPVVSETTEPEVGSVAVAPGDVTEGEAPVAVAGHVVLLSTKQPVSDATVVCRYRTKDEVWPEAGRALSDALGAFRIDGLAPNRRYSLVAMVEESKLMSREAVRIEPAPGETVEDVTIEITDVFCIQGKVHTWDTNEPVAGAVVRAYKLAVTVSADETGEYLLYAPVGLRFGLSCTPPAGYFCKDHVPYAGAVVEGTAAPGTVVKQDFAFIHGGVLRGRVLDEANQPVADAEIRLACMSMSLGEVAAKTDRSGRAEVRYLHPTQEYQAKVTAEGYFPIKLDLRLDGKKRLDQDFVIPRETVALASGASLSGWVVTEDGAPLAGALVSASLVMMLDSSGGYSRHAPSVPVLECRTGADGSFAITPCYEGFVVVRIQDANGITRTRTHGAGYTQKAEMGFELTPGEQKVVTIPVANLGGAIKGRVRDASRRPLEGVQVSAAGADLPPITALTDSGGEFLLADLQNLRYTLTFTKEGFGRNVLFEVIPSPQALDVVLGAPSSLTVRVVDKRTGQPPSPEQHIAVGSLMGPEPLPRGEEIAPGCWRFENVFPGRYMLTLDGNVPQLVATCREVWVPSGKQVECTMEALAGCRATFHCVSDTNPPIPGAGVELQFVSLDSQVTQGWCDLDENGDGEIYLAPGAYEVHGYRSRTFLPTQTISVPQREEAHFELTYPVYEGKIAVTSDLRNEPCKAAACILRDAASASRPIPRHCPVDDAAYRRANGILGHIGLRDGQGETMNVPPGDYAVTAVLYDYHTEEIVWQKTVLCTVSASGSTAIEINQ